MHPDRPHVLRTLGVAAAFLLAAHGGVALGQGCSATESAAEAGVLADADEAKILRSIV